ncbi:hypothetical protein [Zavarzinella formosa]|uniref:hypothetical protein n=1 Tax=Zavarzinella formosa TaxID=360055 RepID=UPI0003140959|nr:hypothetical protein [Zavarzinella formosa]
MTHEEWCRSHKGQLLSECDWPEFYEVGWGVRRPMIDFAGRVTGEIGDENNQETVDVRCDHGEPILGTGMPVAVVSAETARLLRRRDDEHIRTLHHAD